MRGKWLFLVHVPEAALALRSPQGREELSPSPEQSVPHSALSPGVPQPRVHPCHHEADVLPALPGHVQREALQQLLPERGQGLPGQPGRPQHRVEVPDG